MEKDIKNLQEIINLCNKELDNKDENVTATLDLTDLLSLRDLIKAYKEEEADLYSANSIINEQIDIINNSVSIDKVKELINKIDEKTNRIAETYKYSDSDEELARKKGQVRHYEYFIKELQELLEGDE